MTKPFHKVASHKPKIAKIIPASQALITILGSSQPIAKNVWCRGASLKIGFFKTFQPNIWIAEDEISTTKIPPITTSAIILPVKSPITASVAPNDKAPVSPSQILAGHVLKYKNAIKAPIHRAINKESGVSIELAAITPKAIKQIINSPDAKPS